MERPAAAAGGGGGASSAAAAPDAGAAAATQARGDAASQALEPPGVGERLEVSTRTVSARRQRCALASFERPRRAAVAARVPRPGAADGSWVRAHLHAGKVVAARGRRGLRANEVERRARLANCFATLAGCSSRTVRVLGDHPLSLSDADTR